ncbi:Phosphoenolpyruvate/pyruvate domain-containing protein [Aspergillus keveii]|uniref:Phosphoenolpyruvate/pyruvate domain-containing protein n=1 Tax=Aspergillus keveii TaxID=714993 RepID=A0ABR4FQY0_9EURO
MSSPPQSLATLATTLKSLHTPGNPLILANIYDAPSAMTIAALPSSKALATASYAVAEAAGTTDDELPLSELLRSAKIISRVIPPFGKPLSVDIRDGYGDALEDAVKALITEAGAVGINLEDYYQAEGRLYTVSEAVDRIKRVLNVARDLGVPDFVVNARCDVLVKGRALEEVIDREKAYLAAGATIVFVWGGSGRGGLSREEVIRLVEAFGGRLNVLKSGGGLSVKELAEIGVARISVGPLLQGKALKRIREVAAELLEY